MNPWAVRAVERFAIFVLGLFWFVGVVVLESHLRSGIFKKQLWQRIVRVAIALAAVLVISYSLQVFTIF
jgi:putative copper export protein